jgi:hypothetical protein
METLGHSTIALTMNTYSHVSRALQREAAGRMDEVLRQMVVQKVVDDSQADSGAELKRRAASTK